MSAMSEGLTELVSFPADVIETDMLGLIPLESRPLREAWRLPAAN
jgi:hypothetical protein